MASLIDQLIAERDEIMEGISKVIKDWRDNHYFTNKKGADWSEVIPYSQADIEGRKAKLNEMHDQLQIMNEKIDLARGMEDGSNDTVRESKRI